MTFTFPDKHLPFIYRTLEFMRLTCVDSRCYKISDNEKIMITHIDYESVVIEASVVSQYGSRPSDKGNGILYAVYYVYKDFLEWEKNTSVTGYTA